MLIAEIDPSRPRPHSSTSSVSSFQPQSRLTPAGLTLKFAAAQYEDPLSPSNLSHPPLATLLARPVPRAGRNSLKGLGTQIAALS